MKNIIIEPVEQVKFSRMHLTNKKKAFVTIMPGDELHTINLSELNFCLQTYGCDNGILKGKFEYIKYRGNWSLLCVGSKRHTEIMQKVNM